ncbi:MAG: hypothetical protein J1E57_00290 [Prevotella sp.]|nr:hypothetical protein [Prevotella sp.]
MEMMQNWKVKLQTPLTSKLKEDGNTGVLREVYSHTQYEFTLAEALEYIRNDKLNYARFDDMMLHNVVLRDAMRNFGVKKVINQIKEFAPASEKLEELFERFQNKYSDDCIGNLDIQVYSVIENFQIFGETLHGLDDILAYMEISIGINQTSASIEKPEKRGELHVGQLWERYPCFDLSDYATERCFYQNYIIRKEPIRETEILQLKKFRISERIPLDMLPMVYYVGDGGFMLVATCRE